MKSARLICMFAMCGALMACTREEIIPAAENAPNEPEQAEYLVSLALTGEIEVSQDPLTKSTPTNDLYGINIYFDKEKDGVTNDVYGYGLFDNREDMKVTLLGGHKYKFACSLVKNGKSTLFYGTGALGNTSGTGYAYPFQTGGSSTVLGNQFVLGTSYLSGLASSYVHLKGKATPTTSNYSRYAPGIERYYGETDNYTPAVNGSVSIGLKKTVFGAKFVIEGIQDGTLTASCGDLWSKTAVADDPGVESIYSYLDQQDCWKNNSALPMTVSLSFKGNGGDDLLKATQSVTFKRNTLTVVTIQIPGGTFSITEEPLSEDNYIDLELNEDGKIDTPVVPNPGE